MLALFQVKPALGERAVRSPPPLLFPLLLDPRVQFRDGADAPDGILDSLGNFLKNVSFLINILLFIRQRVSSLAALFLVLETSSPK